ncbi:MAG: tetratricopeptide repeat protein, partial [Acidobacteriota bacterium]
MSEDRRQRGARARGKASGAPLRLAGTAALLALVSIPGLAVPSPSLEPETTAALQRNLGQAEQALDRGEMEIAESRLRSAAFEGLLLIGRSFMVAGKEDGDPQGEAPDLAAARDAFERASGLVVQPRRALFRLALVKLRQDEREAAIVTLRELLAADPADGQARRLLSQALVAGEEIEAAVAELAEGLAANPDDLETAFALATGWLRMGEIERGEALFERVLEARPLPQTRVLIGRTYRDFELYERARALLDAAVAEDPEVRRARYYLGTLTLLENGMDGLAEAIELFEAERLLSPTDLMNQLYLGSAQVESRQFERALPWLEQAAGWPAAAFHAERYRGRALVGLRRFEEAMAHLERALELADGASGRDLSEIHYQLGLATRAAGDREAAAGHFELAKRLGIELAEQHREEFASFLRDELGRTRTGSHRESKFIDPFGTGDALFESLDEEQLLGLRARVREQVAQAFMNLGVLKTREGAMDAAADLFARAAGESPSFPGVQRALGMASFSAGRFAQAAAPLEHALREEEAGLGDADRQ